MNYRVKVSLYVCIVIMVCTATLLMVFRSAALVWLALVITISFVAIANGIEHCRPRRRQVAQVPMPHMVLSAADTPPGMDCVICLCPLDSLNPTVSSQQQDQSHTDMLACGHYFHSKCIETWWAIAHQCPFQCVPVVAVQLESVV
jgi:hypothetical protein